MVHTATTRLRWNLIPACLAGVIGCSPAGGGEGGFQLDEGTVPVGPAPAATPSGTPSDPRTDPGNGSLLGGELATPPPPSSDIAACATLRSEVEISSRPVDIIIALDNSGSMDDEARSVEANINVNFASILQESQVDYRVILVSEHRERAAQDTAVCITSPLSTLQSCPSDAPGLSERFFQYSARIGSSNSFDVLLETYDGREEDDFGLAPQGWREWLRPGSQKVFVEISDDNANTTVGEFVDQLTALAPEHFGADPSQLTFVWHSIVGLAERPIVTDPHVPADPIERSECDGRVYNAGTTYQELSRSTGGLRFPICQFAGYDAVFQRIASDVAQISTGACDFAIPEPPSGRILDLDKVAVSFQPSSGAPAQLLGRVAATADCRPGAFVVDGAGVHLCPEVCDVVSADLDAAVDVLFTCESTLLR